MEDKDKYFETYRKLVDKANKLNDDYYNKGTSTVSDYEYDQLLYRIRDLEAQYQFQSVDSPTINVGAKIQSNIFEKHTHQYPMLSITNTYSIPELKSFIQYMETNYGTNCIAEPKLDGISLSLIYSKSGALQYAVTRGDGKVGEDVTRLALQISNIPKKVKIKIFEDYLVVRGEVVIPWKEFNRINDERILNKEQPFKNPRNLAAGTMRQLDPKVVKERGLKFIAYNIPEDNLVQFPNSEKVTQENVIMFLATLGFETFRPYPIDINNCEEVINFMDPGKMDYHCAIDGVVVKVNNIGRYKEIGMTMKTPNWCTAYKYKATGEYTRIVDIIWQVGRTGKVTPVAKLEPVEIKGSTITFATLHNYVNVVSSDYRVGDLVEVVKSAEVIPYIASIVKEQRLPDSKKIEAPEFCPDCESKLIKMSKDLVCTNVLCQSRLMAAVEMFVSRDAMNIIGIGEKLIENLVKDGYVKRPIDIYYLRDKVNDLVNNGYSKQILDKICAVLDKTIKTSRVSNILTGLGIPHVGKGTANLLLKSLNMYDIMNSNVDQLMTIKGIGYETALSINEFFKDKTNVDLIKEFEKLGFSLFEDDIIVKGNNYIEGKTFVITGSFVDYDRKEITELIVARGGKVSGSVSGATDYLICGVSAGSKLTKAKDLGIEIIDENKFKDMLLEDYDITN